MKPGDQVTIMTGPYAGQQGAIIGIPRKNTLVKLTTGIPVTVPAKALKGIPTMMKCTMMKCHLHISSNEGGRPFDIYYDEAAKAWYYLLIDDHTELPTGPFQTPAAAFSDALSCNY